MKDISEKFLFSVKKSPLVIEFFLCSIFNIQVLAQTYIVHYEKRSVVSIN